MASIDLSQPLATLLRKGTHDAHVNVETSQGAKLLLSGGLPKEDYTVYLMMLWHIYDALERALERHAAHPSLEPTYNPTLLARAPSLSSDIAHLLQVEDWKSHPLHVQFLASSPTPLLTYTQRIEDISKSNDPSALLGHSYVRYLGDLSGGQTIRHTIAKAYNLDEASGLGISFYAFKELRSAKPASQGEMKRIKDWFREGLNVAGQRGVDVKEAVITEASKAFDLNAGLFSIIEVSSDKAKFKGPQTQSQEVSSEKTYPMTQVAAIILAVCLSHFLLVLGGFTGDKGWQKFLAVEQWLGSIWSQASD